MLNFYNTDSPEIVANSLYKKLHSHLINSEKVLWLLSGGSAIKVAVATARLLDKEPVSGLSVSLVDERYGPAGHKDSNWTQLLEEGFSLAGAHLHPVLDGAGFQQNASNYNQFLKQAFSSFDYKIALLGIGDDGHTAGILPGCPAVDSQNIVSSYQGPEYQRITLTPAGITALDEAVVFAQGASKRPALDNLAKMLSVAEQPAQIIKQVPAASVYSNLVGEEI